jgi:short subunit dehydrogenase-like uncharacterized protein
MKKVMIYGASGYTGRMAAEQIRAFDLPLIVAGRSAETLAALAGRLGAEVRTFSVEDHTAIDHAMSDVSLVLNCAGPFKRTALPIIQAAIRNGVHYLDIAAELDSYRLAEQFSESAKAAGVMLLPGSGGSVAMLGCLASHAAARIPNPIKVSVALHVSGAMSRGSAISASENLTTETFVRSGNQLSPLISTDTRLFDFGNGHGPVSCFPVTLPDLITIGRSLAVPDVETFVHVSGSAFPEGDLSALPDGPTEEERAENRYQAAVEVVGANSETVRSVLDTVNGYTFTPIAAAEAVRRRRIQTRLSVTRRPVRQRICGNDRGLPDH